MASGHTIAEIPFRLSSTTKWISGIAEDTTCRDILVAVLRAENILDCDEDIVHHHYALVETWRWVSLNTQYSILSSFNCVVSETFSNHGGILHGAVNKVGGSRISVQ